MTLSQEVIWLCRHALDEMPNFRGSDFGFNQKDNLILSFNLKTNMQHSKLRVKVQIGTGWQLSAPTQIIYWDGNTWVTDPNSQDILNAQQFYDVIEFMKLNRTIIQKFYQGIIDGDELESSLKSLSRQ